MSGGESITVRTTVKALLSEFVTGTSMVGVTYYANSVDLPFGETMLLMMIVGALTGTATNKAFDFAEDGVDNFIYGLKNDDYGGHFSKGAIGDLERRNYEIRYNREKIKDFIKRGTETECPIFAEDTINNKFASLVRNVKSKDGLYDVALHGTPTYAEFFGEPIDAYTLAKILRNREDYKAALKANPNLEIRLLSCSTGDTTYTGDCFAQILANELGVKVYAPTDTIYVEVNGNFYIGDLHDGAMKAFYPRK